MKKILIFLAITLSTGFAVKAQKPVLFTPLIQQAGMYYSSGRFTSDGYGFGLGIHLLHRSGLASQADINLLWLNGNAVPVRIAMGYQRKGTWTPGVYGTINMIFGQGSRILSPSGELPTIPAWAFGIRITPLKFRTKSGYISVLETGCGFGPDRAISLELSLLSMGVSF